MVTRLLAAVVGAAICTSVVAGARGMTLAEYLATKRQLSAAFQDAKTACGADTSMRHGICLVDAMGKDWVAKADLEVAYRSVARTRAEAKTARADARFWLARERCEDGVPRDRSVCLQQAKAMRLAAGTDIAAQRRAEEQDENCASEVAAGGGAASPGCAAAAIKARANVDRGTPP